MPKNKEKDNAPVKAKVIGLWGDPGLTEYSFFDVLSRFLIVQVAPYSDVACRNDSPAIVKLVLRPTSLWINSLDGGSTRRDFLGNLNKQNRSLPADQGKNAATFIDKNILPISPSYKLGDEITLTRLPKPLSFDATSLKDGTAQFNGKFIFNSEDTGASPTNFASKEHKNLESAFSTVDLKTYVKNMTFPVLTPPIVPPPGVNLKFFFGSDDAYVRSFAKILDSFGKFSEFLGPFALAASAVNIAAMVAHMDSSGLISSRGGVISEVGFVSTEYIDSNSENRERPQDSGCLPLIVANPSTFPTPANRNVGGINITL